MIGNDAKRMNLVSEDLMLGFDNGPRSNEKRMSLNVQSQVMKKDVRPVRREEESGSGRMKKRVMNGRWAMRLGVPLGIFEVMKKMKVRDVRIEEKKGTYSFSTQGLRLTRDLRAPTPDLPGELPGWTKNLLVDPALGLVEGTSAQGNEDESATLEVGNPLSVENMLQAKEKEKENEGIIEVATAALRVVKQPPLPLPPSPFTPSPPSHPSPPSPPPALRSGMRKLEQRNHQHLCPGLRRPGIRGKIKFSHGRNSTTYHLFLQPDR